MSRYPCLKKLRISIAPDCSLVREVKGHSSAFDDHSSATKKLNYFHLVAKGPLYYITYDDHVHIVLSLSSPFPETISIQVFDTKID